MSTWYGMWVDGEWTGVCLETPPTEATAIPVSPPLFEVDSYVLWKGSRVPVRVLKRVLKAKDWVYVLKGQALPLQENNLSTAKNMWMGPGWYALLDKEERIDKKGFFPVKHLEKPSDEPSGIMSVPAPAFHWGKAKMLKHLGQTFNVQGAYYRAEDGELYAKAYGGTNRDDGFTFIKLSELIQQKQWTAPGWYLQVAVMGSPVTYMEDPVSLPYHWDWLLSCPAPEFLEGDVVVMKGTPQSYGKIGKVSNPDVVFPNHKGRLGTITGRYWENNHEDTSVIVTGVASGHWVYVIGERRFLGEALEPVNRA